jgi:hypothetical protein
MRTTYLLQIGILALPTIATNTNTYTPFTSLYIYVADKFESEVIVRGPIYPNGVTVEQTHHTDEYDMCTNNTNAFIINSQNPACKGHTIHTFMGSIYLDANGSEPRHLDISMVGYNLSVRFGTHPGSLS